MRSVETLIVRLPIECPYCSHKYLIYKSPPENPQRSGGIFICEKCHSLISPSIVSGRRNIGKLTWRFKNRGGVVLSENKNSSVLLYDFIDRVKNKEKHMITFEIVPKKEEDFNLGVYEYMKKYSAIPLEIGGKKFIVRYPYCPSRHRISPSKFYDLRKPQEEFLRAIDNIDKLARLDEEELVEKLMKNKHVFSVFLPDKNAERIEEELKNLTPEEYEKYREKVRALAKLWKEGFHHFFLWMATGLGKTDTAIASIPPYLWKEILEKRKKKCLIIVPSDFLREQWVEDVLVGEWGVPRELIEKAVGSSFETKPFIVATIQTLHSLRERDLQRYEEIMREVGIALLDECHNYTSPKWKLIVQDLMSDKYGKKEIRLLTATPKEEVTKFFLNMSEYSKRLSPDELFEVSTITKALVEKAIRSGGIVPAVQLNVGFDLTPEERLRYSYLTGSVISGSNLFGVDDPNLVNLMKKIFCTWIKFRSRGENISFYDVLKNAGKGVFKGHEMSVISFYENELIEKDRQLVKSWFEDMVSRVESGEDLTCEFVQKVAKNYTYSLTSRRMHLATLDSRVRAFTATVFELLKRYKTKRKEEAPQLLEYSVWSWAPKILVFDIPLIKKRVVDPYTRQTKKMPFIEYVRRKLVVELSNRFKIPREIADRLVKRSDSEQRREEANESYSEWKARKLGTERPEPFILLTCQRAYEGIDVKDVEVGIHFFGMRSETKAVQSYGRTVRTTASLYKELEKLGATMVRIFAKDTVDQEIASDTGLYVPSMVKMRDEEGYKYLHVTRELLSYSDGKIKTVDTNNMFFEGVTKKGDFVQIPYWYVYGGLGGEKISPSGVIRSRRGVAGFIPLDSMIRLFGRGGLGEEKCRISIEKGRRFVEKELKAMSVERLISSLRDRLENRGIIEIEEIEILHHPMDQGWELNQKLRCPICGSPMLVHPSGACFCPRCAEREGRFTGGGRKIYVVRGGEKSGELKGKVLGVARSEYGLAVLLSTIQLSIPSLAVT